jgi:rubrerythrin
MKTLDDWLDHAIAREQFAHDYYVAAIGRVPGEAAKSLLSRLADEETGHRTRLEAVKRKGDWANLGRGLKDPGADFAGDRAFVPLEGEVSPKEILSVAILHEDNARLFYQWFVEVYAGTELEDFFRKLVQEEQRHAELLAELEKTL